MENYNPFSLKGKTILITGASSGIGQATAIECSKLGANVIITGRNKEKLNQTFQMLEENGQTHQQILADITDDSDIDKLVDQLPKIDGLVNNAGIVFLKPLLFYTRKSIEEILQTNLVSQMLITKAVLKGKKIKKNGSIVFTSSIGGVYSVSIANGIYAAAKNGIDAFMRTAALELGHKGIRVNSINPGMTETKLAVNDNDLSAEDFEKDKKTYVLGRYGQPKEIAWGIIYLLSDASSWVTGTSLKIDGGKTLSC